jgi:hypothetical protein
VAQDQQPVSSIQPLLDAVDAVNERLDRTLEMPWPGVEDDSPEGEQVDDG